MTAQNVVIGVSLLIDLSRPRFVTLPFFETRGASARILSGISNLNYCPLVTDENREAWEKYTVDNQAEFFATLSADEQQRQFQDASYNADRRDLEQFELELLRVIDNLDGPAPNGTGPYLPIWQATPATPLDFFINFNVLSHPTGQKAYKQTLETGQAVLDFADNMSTKDAAYEGTIVFLRLLLSLSQYRDVIDDFLGDPSS